MKNLSILVILCCLVVFGCTSEPAAADKTATETEKTIVKETPHKTKQAPARKDESKSKVNWISIDNLEELSKKESRKVLVDLYTDWCGWCKRMDKSTFNHPEIAEYLNNNFYSIKFNAENKSNINFKGKDYKFVAAGRRGYNELAYKFANGRLSYPTIAFLDEDLNIIQAFPGYKQAHQFDPLLHFISEDHYKSDNYMQFSKGFKSNIAAPAQPANQRRVTTKRTK